MVKEPLFDFNNGKIIKCIDFVNCEFTESVAWYHATYCIVGNCAWNSLGNRMFKYLSTQNYVLNSEFTFGIE